MGGALRIGTSGWSYPAWRGRFYPKGLPAGRWLEHYARLFDAVELNASFYRLPGREQVAGWAARTPAEFRFAVKAWRALTHLHRLEPRADLLEAFLARYVGRDVRSPVEVGRGAAAVSGVDS